MADKFIGMRKKGDDGALAEIIRKHQKERNGDDSDAGVLRFGLRAGVEKIQQEAAKKKAVKQK